MNLVRSLVRETLRLWYGSRRPVRAGTVRVSGLERDVEIGRDEFGVPYIEAATERDVWYGLGFCQGQDRSFQIDTLVRAARGRLSELVGAEMVPLDRLARRIGFGRSARRQYEMVESELAAILEAFAEGVEAGRGSGRSETALEFALLNGRPVPFEPHDVLAILKLTSFTLPTNWDAELARLMVWAEDGPEAVRALDPAYREGQPLVAPVGDLSGEVIDRLERELEWFREQVSLGGGSNAWAVSGQRTVSGRPLLANDPHLAPQLPPHWYLARCRTPDWTAVGAALIGVPGITAGHNGALAWGLTAGMVDNTDLFLEELDAEGRRYRDPDGMRPCTVRTERIAVRGEDPVEEVVRETARGPVISPLVEEEPYALSLRATWLDPVGVEGFHELHRAKNGAEFRRAFRAWPFLSLGFVDAASDASPEAASDGSSGRAPGASPGVSSGGSIGWELVGAVPGRTPGSGIMPRAGWHSEAQWVEADAISGVLAEVRDPAAGYVVTANNRPTEDADDRLGWDWIDGYRAGRIAERLSARSDWTVGGFQDLQRDLHVPVWDELSEAITGLVPESRDAELALELLREWDGRMTASSPAASVFELFLMEMVERVVRARAPGSAQWALGEGFHPMLPHTIFGVRRVGHLVGLIQDRPEGWFDRGWRAEMHEALEAAVRRLRDRAGSDPDRWAWGRLRTLTFEHPAGRRWPLDRLFNRGPFPRGGDSNTVSQASVYPGDPFGEPIFVPSLRMVVDVGAWEESRFVLPGGQSGNPLSPHYDDQLTLWRSEEAIPIPFDQERAADRVRDRLVLRAE